jgi:hypothetical protein
MYQLYQKPQYDAYRCLDPPSRRHTDPCLVPISSIALQSRTSYDGPNRAQTLPSRLGGHVDSSGTTQPLSSELNAPSQKNDSPTSSKSTSAFGYIDMFSPWFLNVDPAYNESKGFKTWRTWHSKREILLWTGFLSSTSVLMINAVFVCVLARKHGFGSNRGVISLYEGECAWTKRVNTGAHVCINILSTFLLGASNVCMQLLAAPTRDEVDAAHQRRVWLDIGIPSWKNLRNIKRSRVWVWALLGLSSIPLHFM